jgi:hypothetical protein
MNGLVVDQPSYLAWLPFDRKPVSRLRGVEPKLNVARCASISIVVLHTLITGIVEDIQQETIRSATKNLDVNLLPRRIAMQEESSDHSRHVRSLDDGLESPEEETIATGYRRGAVAPNAERLAPNIQRNANVCVDFDIRGSEQGQIAGESIVPQEPAVVVDL